MRDAYSCSLVAICGYFLAFLTDDISEDGRAGRDQEVFFFRGSIHTYRHCQEREEDKSGPQKALWMSDAAWFWHGRAGRSACSGKVQWGGPLVVKQVVERSIGLTVIVALSQQESPWQHFKQIQVAQGGIYQEKRGRGFGSKFLSEIVGRLVRRDRSVCALQGVFPPCIELF